MHLINDFEIKFLKNNYVLILNAKNRYNLK